MRTETIVSSATIIGSVAAVIAVFIMGGQLRFISEELQREIIRYEEIERTVLARKPDVVFLEPFIQPAAESFYVVVPIQNMATSNVAIAHRVQVAIAFSPDNLIKEVHAHPFIMIDGGEGSHSVNLELSVLYPRSVIYTSFLVANSEKPVDKSIGWAEETGVQSIPLKD